VERKKKKTKKCRQRISSEISVKVRGIRGVGFEEKEGCEGKDLQKRKVLSLE